MRFGTAVRMRVTCRPGPGPADRPVVRVVVKQSYAQIYHRRHGIDPEHCEQLVQRPRLIRVRTIWDESTAAAWMGMRALRPSAPREEVSIRRSRALGRERASRFQPQHHDTVRATLGDNKERQARVLCTEADWPNEQDHVAFGPDYLQFLHALRVVVEACFHTLIDCFCSYFCGKIDAYRCGGSTADAHVPE